MEHASYIVDQPLRNSAIAVVAKQWSSKDPELVRRFTAHMNKLNKLKNYNSIELVLREYNMTLTFSTLERNKEGMAYTIDNLEYAPPADLRRQNFLKNLFE
jgi:hypothetical protein